VTFAAGATGGGSRGTGAGAANRGNGGGAGAFDNTNGGTDGRAGGSGILIVRYPNLFTITIGPGLTGSTATVGLDRVTTITQGTGNISFTLTG
jgi:hypothetical protein